MKKMGRPAKETEAVNVRLELHMLKKIDDARRMEEDLPTRPEMIRRILENWASKQSRL